MKFVIDQWIACFLFWRVSDSKVVRSAFLFHFFIVHERSIRSFYFNLFSLNNRSVKSFVQKNLSVKKIVCSKKRYFFLKFFRKTVSLVKKKCVWKDRFFSKKKLCFFLVFKFVQLKKLLKSFINDQARLNEFKSLVIKKH